MTPDPYFDPSGDWWEAFGWSCIGLAVVVVVLGLMYTCS